MKAYCFANASDFDIEDVDEVTFAESAGKAKQNFSMESGVHFRNIRVQRMPWADKYASVEAIPAEEWLEHGWYFICNICGEYIDDATNLFSNNKGYCCKKCYEARSGKNDC